MKRTSILIVLLLMTAVMAGCSGETEERHPAMKGLEGGWDITITRLDGTEEVRRVYPSESGADFDKDGEDDLQEYMHKTDPNDPDTSGNGLLDGENVTLDTDSDRAKEWVERRIVHFEGENGHLVFQGSRPWRVDPTMVDTSGDGIPDGDEVRGFEVWILGEQHFFQTDPRRYDDSGDGLPDGLKRDLGLDPTSRDTDGDGTGDTNDVNPWVDFQIRLDVSELILQDDPEGRAERDIRLILQIAQERYESDHVSVQRGESTEGDAFTSGILAPSDAGGNILQGRHNVTFTLTTLSETRGGSGLIIDLFSKTTGSESLFGSIHALSAQPYWSHGAPGGDASEWPDTATFEGEHGSITLDLRPVWSDAWQHCIDQECRHGDGLFEWWKQDS